MQNIQEYKNYVIEKFKQDGLRIEQLGCDNKICKNYLNFVSEGNSVYHYLPNPRPRMEKVKHFFICKEPSSFGEDDQRSYKEGVDSGKRLNFIPPNDKITGLTVFHLAILNTLLNESYYITDLSKCAMDVEKARSEVDKGYERYQNCNPILVAEIKKYTNNDTKFYLVGKFNREKRKGGFYLKFKKNELKLAGVKDAVSLPHYSFRQVNWANEILIRILNNSGQELKRYKKLIENGYKHIYEMMNKFFQIPPEIVKLQEKQEKKVSDVCILFYLLYENIFNKLAAHR